MSKFDLIRKVFETSSNREAARVSMSQDNHSPIAKHSGKQKVKKAATELLTVAAVKAISKQG